jgi:predicted transposase/invertase (TIGR01784 family)
LWYPKTTKKRGDSFLDPDISANVKFKDSFFSKLFSEPERILKLYNALSSSKYPLNTPIEITTLENVLYKDRYNDLSFVLDGRLVVLIEHQSSVNPNMLIRLLIYLAKVYDKYIKEQNVYSSKLIKIPRPEFIVLYNGTDSYPDENILKLSDAFFNLPDRYKPNGSLELTVRVLNINKGHNEAIVDESAELYGYVVIVDEIRKNKASGMSLEEAVSKAVKDCANQNILSDFLAKYGGEVITMLYTEWNLEEYVAMQKKEYAEQVAHDKAITTAKKALDKGLSLNDAADLADLPLAEVEALVVVK